MGGRGCKSCKGCAEPYLMMNFYTWAAMKKRGINMSQNYWEKKHWIPIPMGRPKEEAEVIL